MTNEHEKDKPFEGEQTPRARGTNPKSPAEKEDIETVSLLDLMAEAGFDTSAGAAEDKPEPPAEEVKDKPAAEADAGSPTRPTSGVSGDEPTLTEVPLPDAPPARPKPIPLPLSPDQLTPQKRPLEKDQDATEVQPRVAFPGRTRPGRPLSEAPTQVQQERLEPRPKRDEGGAPTVQQPSVRRPARQQPGQRSLTGRAPRPAERQRQPAQPQPARRPEPVPVAMPRREQQPYPQTAPRRRRNWRSCLSRLALTGAVTGLIGLMLLIIGAAIGFRLIARDLPSPAELEARASAFETARIFDRNGNLLYSLADPSTGNRTRVTLDQISPYLIQATIATEDSRFYDNPGFDPLSIGRAIWQAAREREFVSGASTITQQLVRAVLLEEDERTERTFRRKVREIILAAELSRTYDKDEILEIYLNEIYYGNRAYGIEAAAQTYFNKPAADLTLAEASLLAGLPQAPALWDPYTAPEQALRRQWEVLNLMVAEGYATREEAQAALDETSVFIFNLTPPVSTVNHPHFTFTVLQQAEDLLGAQSIYRGGLRIHTTLDPEAQRLAESVVANHRSNISSAAANNAALVSLRPDTGEILALVGSVDFNNEAISGQVNMALAPRQPGSALKPFVYLSAMERGWTAATLIWDVPTAFPNGPNPPYEPKNFDDEFHGPLRLRPALGNSYNIPAVKALEFVGVCDFIANVQKVGLTSLQDPGCAEVGQPRNYGLALALGGGEISPLELAAAYGVLANQGQYLKPFAVNRIENRQGEILYQYTPADPAQTQVVRPEHAYILSDILSDNSARQPEFGVNNNLVIPGHRVAAKTGTSGTTRSDVRDVWTVGYTPQVVTAVWVGNTNNEPLAAGESGSRTASPIWNSFMTQYLADKQPVDFVRPPGTVDAEICAGSGTRPSPGCGERRLEIFAEDQLPLDSDHDFVQVVPVDLWTGLRANEACPESVYEAGFFDPLVSGQESVLERERTLAQRWLEQTTAGQNWAQRHNVSIPLRLPPAESCSVNPVRPEVNINQPQAGAEVINNVDIRGTARGPNFGGYQVEYGLGNNPGGWGLVQGRQEDPVENNLLASWDATTIDYSGALTLRVLIFGPDNPFTPEVDPPILEHRVTVTLMQPTATPTPTPTITPTATSTATPTPTTPATATPASPTPEPTPTEERVRPTRTPNATPTDESEPTEEAPTETPEP
ncbi:MAG TPA: PBP1A family penicillin-binding protein [Anaerolineae bacterium]